MVDQVPSISSQNNFSSIDLEAGDNNYNYNNYNHYIAEMNEKMFNLAMSHPQRVPQQPPVTVIPMMFPMVYPQQVYAPPHRRGS